MPNDPVNVLAQLWLWRLEARVLAGVIVAGIGAAYALVDLVSGPDTAQVIIDIAGTAAIIAPVWFLGCAIYTLVSPAAQSRRMDKAMARYQATINRR